MSSIDLNCDLGESFGPWVMGNDEAMIELATSVNVACGFHAGDADIMRKTVELAKARGVSIGAHPGYRDLHGFGRRPVPGLKSSEIENMIAYQIGALQAIATAAGHKVTHVKAHGALSNVACEDDMTARAIANAIKAVDPSLIFVVLADSRLVTAGEKANLPMVHEVFADRAYEDDGQLVSRRKPGAVLHDAGQITDRVVRMVEDEVRCCWCVASGSAHENASGLPLRVRAWSFSNSPSRINQIASLTRCKGGHRNSDACAIVAQVPSRKFYESPADEKFIRSICAKIEPVPVEASDQ